MNDLISRQSAIETLTVGAELLRRVLDSADIVGTERAKYEWGLGLIESYISDMKELPSAQAKLDENDMPEQGDSAKLGVKTGETCTDCISRQAAIDEIARWIGYIDEDMILRIQTGLKKVPSAQPEIIRCRDCKNWDKTWTSRDPGYHYCPMIDGVRDGNFYCADGERREEDVKK